MRLTTKQKYYTIILLVCLVIIVAAGGVLMWHHNHHNNKTPANMAKTPQAVVDITSSGFVPATLHVKLGTIIVWQNQDSASHKVASNPYPLDNSLPGLASGTILPNGSYRFKPTAAGTINYHDDTKPVLNGSVTVSK